MDVKQLGAILTALAPDPWRPTTADLPVRRWRPAVELLEGRLVLTGGPLVGPLPPAFAQVASPATDLSDASEEPGREVPGETEGEAPAWVGTLVPLSADGGPIPVPREGGADLLLTYPVPGDVVRFRFDATVTGPMQVEMWPADDARGAAWVRVRDDQGNTLPLTAELRAGPGHVVQFQAEEGKTYLVETGVADVPTSALGRLFLWPGTFPADFPLEGTGQTDLEPLTDVADDLVGGVDLAQATQPAADLAPLSGSPLALVATLGIGVLRVRVGPATVAMPPDRIATALAAPQSPPRLPAAARLGLEESLQVGLGRAEDGWRRPPADAAPLPGGESSAAAPFSEWVPLPPGSAPEPSTPSVSTTLPATPGNRVAITFRADWEAVEMEGEDGATFPAVSVAPAAPDLFAPAAAALADRPPAGKGDDRTEPERRPRNNRGRVLFGTLLAVLCTWGIHQALGPGRKAESKQNRR